MKLKLVVAQAGTARARQRMAKRFSREIMRICLHGNLRPEKYPEMDARNKLPAVRLAAVQRADPDGALLAHGKIDVELPS